MQRFYTDFMVPSGSFLIGAGSVFNIAGKYFSYNRSVNGQVADARALRQDFIMIGQDIRGVVQEINEQRRQQLNLPLDS